jgi:hypothetical protein
MLLDHFIMLKVHNDIFVDKLELHLGQLEAFCDLFDLMQPHACLETTTTVVTATMTAATATTAMTAPTTTAPMTTVPTTTAPTTAVTTSLVVEWFLAHMSNFMFQWEYSVFFL